MSDIILVKQEVYSKIGRRKPMRQKDDTLREVLLNVAHNIANTEGIERINIRVIAHFFKVQKKEEKLKIQIESNCSVWYNMF